MNACRTIPGWIALTIGVLSTASATSLSGFTAALPDVPAPPQGEVQWVARSMRLNGLPMTLKTFQSRLAPDQVLSFYEARAQAWAHTESRRRNGPQAQILSLRSDRYVVTIEARAAIGGSEGTITVSDLPERFTALVDSRFPRPRTTRLLNRQEYDDDGIEAEHLSLSSSRSAAIEADAFVSELQRHGWLIIRHQPLQTQGAARGRVIEAQYGAELAQVTLQPDHSRPSATAIVVIWRKS